MPSFSNLTSLVSVLIWPLTIVGGVFFFRGEVKRLLGRLVRISKEGAEFDKPAQASATFEREDVTKISRQALERAPTEHYAPAFRPVVDNLQQKILVHLNEQSRQTNVTRESLLLRGFADTVAALLLERIYRFIFGSQIDALEFLAYQPNFTSSRDEIRKHYDAAFVAYPGVYNDYSFDDWLNFLLRAELVKISDRMVTLTDLGLAMPGYIVAQRYSKRLPY